MKTTPHFIAQLSYLPTGDGGRQTPARSGYRPHIEFDHIPGKRTTGMQRFIGQEWVEPGQTVEAEITVVSPKFFSGKIQVGDTFTFDEGPRVVGTGVVKEVVDERLMKKN
ncbi:EF-Tu C-terminal domain-related protein [Phaeocystidibacter luteus]|uniref:Translation elongation factor EFTu/EF1A C-terminal domain-containing protein n=1 Tax=Phaeocystidibacter luteus TaxID=911197 RepID=A0A6N6RE94_9FLAO|nr:hypothetical protein [Phaeocystidibacter luteus]KAB2807705.1 hypothetical protein F8C67_11735 [Phaeocystidibacter luteus]